MPVSRLFFAVYILYLDESGNPGDPADRHFVLAGVAVFERSVHYIAESIDRIQANHFPGSPPIEFHANAIRSGRGFWRDVEKEKRERVLSDIGTAVQRSNEPGLVLFAAVVQKDYELHGENAIRKALEEICNRFNIFLKVREKEHNDNQRGLLVFAESTYQQRAKVWVNDFKRLGTQWGTLNRVCDIPYFASTRETRLLQIADYVSHAAFLLHERSDPSLIRPIIHRFDHKGGIFHGLVHVGRGKTGCECPACASRRSPGSSGAWMSATAKKLPTERS
jgi:hypothetical protein